MGSSWDVVVSRNRTKSRLAEVKSREVEKPERWARAGSGGAFLSSIGTSGLHSEGCWELCFTESVPK